VKDIPAVYDNLIFFRRLYYNLYNYNPANTYRQVFILLMSAFDAVISDIAYEYFKCSTSLLNNIIKIYEKDESTFIRFNKNRLNGVVELIRRRNIHLHKKGIVDEGYLQIKYPKNNKVQYEFDNTYQLQFGQLAVINEEYYYNVLTLLKHVVENLN